MISVQTKFPWMMFRDFMHPSLVTYQPVAREYWVEERDDHSVGSFALADWGFRWRVDSSMMEFVER